MGTLIKLEQKMRLDSHFQTRLLGSRQNEILIDLDGDGEADMALLDTEGNGDIAFLAIDPTGRGDFDLYIGDTDEKGLPVVLLHDASADTARQKREAEQALIAAASRVRSAVITGDYIEDTLEEKLEELQEQLRQTKSALKETKRRTYTI